ncbi:amino acid adenylation domain-containing protein [Kordia sp. YSTF-M3]|uniref:Amino acid adenylation domain-containing protein n=1 Tax=Kordia aestuariivivens TaxID=2759037 RepID=A0ABR7QGN4_9FLAO|nr:non-ribosomal peptide synthetase [Kordia aestuariivivens]MBC8757653.1 amino acid adenylation domain-containing protein [Kordia aestuariivivens]
MNTNSASEFSKNTSWTAEEEVHFSFKQKNSTDQNEKSTFAFEIDAAKHPAFFKLAKTNETISLVVLFSAFSMLMRKYTFQENIVINTPHLEGVENDPLHIPVSLHVDTNRSFKEHLKMCQETLKDLYSKQKSDLLSKGSTSNVLFIYENVHDKPLQNGVDFMFACAIKDDKLRVNINYDSSCYEAYFIENIITHFNACLEIFQKPDTFLNQVDIVSGEEENTIINLFNNTAKKYDSDKTLIDLFEEKVISNTDTHAVIYKGTKLSYAQLNNRVNTLADFLIEDYDLKEGECVGLMLERSDLWLISLLAIWKCGAVYVPLDLKLPVERRDAILSKTNANFLITDSDSMFELQEFTGNFIAVDIQVEFDDAAEVVFENKSNKEQTAYIIHTSGSTGEPKAIPIKHKSISDRMLYHVDYLELTNHTVLQFASISFDASLVEIFMALIAGNTLVIASEREKNDTNVLTKLLETHDVNVVIFPPSYLKILNKRELPTLQKIITTGEKASINDCIHYSQTKDVYNGYGPSETCIGASFYKISYDKKDFYENNSVPIGEPFANTTILLLNEDAKLTPIGLQGEICVAGVGLSDGYLNNDDLTAEKFITTSYLNGARVYKTGDYATFSNDGTLNFNGRMDSQVQLNGIRVELHEIEEAITTHNAVKNAVVIVHETVGKKQLIAFVETVTEINSETLKSYLSKIIPPYMLPNTFMYFAAFPVNNAGKVDVKTLKKQIKTSSKTTVSKEIIEPTTEYEKHITTIFEEVLLEKPFSITGSFFEYGGNSLKAIQVVSEVYKLTGITIDVRDVFDYSTPQLLAKHTENYNKKEEIISPVSNDTSIYDISFNQKRFLGFEKSFRAMSKGAPNNAFPGSFKLIGNLNVTAFEKALYHIVQRHESLRTLFVEMEDGELKQQVFDTAEKTFSYNYHDLTDEAAQKEKIEELLDVEDKTSIDLFNGPLLRIRLIKKSAEEHLLILVIHHIVSDGWSMNVLFDELFDTYNNFCQNKDATLKPLDIHYKEFAYWKNDKINKGELENSKEFWFSYLKDLTQALDFPHTVEATSFEIYNGFDHEILLDETFTQTLRKQAASYNTTIFTLLVAGLKLLIHGVTNKKDVAIASVNAGREHKALNNQIGYYANDTIFRTNMDASQTVSEYVHSIKKNILDVFSHQNYPYSLLVDQLEFAECPIGIGIENFTKVGNNVQMEGISLTTETTSVYKWFGRSFSFNFTEHEDTITLKVVYNSSRFTLQDSKEKANQYVQILNLLLEDDHQVLNDIINTVNTASS